MEERQKVAKEFAESLELKLPMLVDAMDDRVGKAYAGWPDRLYVIDAEGKVALKARSGPAGFMPAVREAPAVLEKLLKRPR